MCRMIFDDKVGGGGRFSDSRGPQRATLFPTMLRPTSPEVSCLLTIWPRTWIWIRSKLPFDSNCRYSVNNEFCPHECTVQMHLNEQSRKFTGWCQWAEKAFRVSDPSCRFSRGKVRNSRAATSTLASPKHSTEKSGHWEDVPSCCSGELCQWRRDSVRVLFSCCRC